MTSAVAVVRSMPPRPPHAFYLTLLRPITGLSIGYHILSARSPSHTIHNQPKGTSATLQSYHHLGLIPTPLSMHILLASLRYCKERLCPIHPVQSRMPFLTYRSYPSPISLSLVSMRFLLCFGSLVIFPVIFSHGSESGLDSSCSI